MRRPIAALALLLAAAPAWAQPAPAPQTQQPQAAPPANLGPRAPKAESNPFAVASWASLDEPKSTLIRTPAQIDLAAREEQAYILVYGHRKKGPDVAWHPRVDGGAPAWSDAAIPQEIPVGAPTSCGGEAYRTIGGQAATGADMVGALGGGRC